MSDLSAMQSFANSLFDLEVKVYDAKRALLVELASLAETVDQLPPAMRYEAVAKLEGLKRRIG